ncbi:MAG: Nif3-like dinuclear metal center hexameric protein [Ruminococcaceae bacterium]|nr:Nif3-like dinuclear metal center hexameric protein [Oscillospiraceae bacterium]
MNRRKLYEALCQSYPKELSCSWDNDGAMLCLDWDKEVKKALVCLDVTDEAVRAACDEGCDLIVSHHPFIFRGVKSIDGDGLFGRRVKALCENNIAVFSFHTRADCARGGLNDRFAAAIGLENVTDVLDPEEGLPLGRIGTLEDCSAEEAALIAASALGQPVKLFKGSDTAKRLMCVCGGGKEFLPLAQKEGCDTFLSGDLSYNLVLDCTQSGLNVIEVSHYSSEILCLDMFCEAINAADSDITVIKSSFGACGEVVFPEILGI